MKTRAAILLTLPLLLGSPQIVALGEDTEPSGGNQATHEELRTLRDGLEAGYKTRNIEALLEHVHENVVITWQNGERSRGHAGLRAFHDRMFSGDQPVVQSLTSQLTVDELSVFHGPDTAVAFGRLDETYLLTSGDEFSLESQWTATCTRVDGRWLIASFHVSTNLFDNPLLTAASAWIYKAAALSGVLALLIGLLVGRQLKRNPREAE